jgi:hypothetical protein
MDEGSGMKTRVAIGTAPRRAAWVGYAACAWAFLFAIAHFYWALGGAQDSPLRPAKPGLAIHGSSPTIWLPAFCACSGR